MPSGATIIFIFSTRQTQTPSCCFCCCYCLQIVCGLQVKLIFQYNIFVTRISKKILKAFVSERLGQFFYFTFEKQILF